MQRDQTLVDLAHRSDIAALPCLVQFRRKAAARHWRSPRCSRRRLGRDRRRRSRPLPKAEQNPAPISTRMRSGRARSLVASLTPTMFGNLARRAIVAFVMSTDGAARDIVNNDRQIDGVVNRLEMLIEPFLRRLVVIGADDQRRIGAGLLGLPRQLDRVLGRVRAGSGNDRNPLPLATSTHSVDQPLLLVIGERRRFAGRAARHQSVRALADLPGHMLLKGGLVQLVVAKRRDQRDERSLEHRFLRDCGIAALTIVLAAIGFNSARTARTGAAALAARELRRADLLRGQKNSKSSVASSLIQPRSRRPCRRSSAECWSSS